MQKYIAKDANIMLHTH